MSNLTEKTFKADIIDTKSITLNGVSLDSYSIMTETDSREVQNIAGDLQVRITPDMLDENGNYVIKNLPDGGNFKYSRVNVLSSLRDPNILVNDSMCNLNTIEKNGSTTFLPNLYGGKTVISAIKEVNGIVYYKKLGDSNIYKETFTSEEPEIVTGITFGGTDIVNTHFFDTVSGRYIRIPYSQFSYLGGNFTFEVKMYVNGTDGCNIHFSNNGDNTYTLWYGGWTPAGWNTHRWEVVNTVVKYYKNGVLSSNPMPANMNLSIINRDLLLGADWDDTYINDYSRVYVDYVAFWDGSGTLVNYYNFQNDEFGTYLVNKGENTVSATHNGTMNVWPNGTEFTTLQTSKLSDVSYDIMNVNTNELVINTKDNIFDTITIDLWV